ncbi:MAG: molybdopterin molybdotransferase MoeA [Myxococcales bacterium]|nr:molybdopterin molybdotransferase MoeA [Myxococcales bacterium]
MADLELDIADAQGAVLAHTAPAPAASLALADALGRVLAADLRSRWSLPAGDVSTMDGWAVRLADLGGHGTRVGLRRAGESAAGHPLDVPLAPGHAARIFTGALLPPGADLVIAQEDAHVLGDSLEIDLVAAGPLAAGHFTRAAGSDVAEGAPLLAAGAVLGPGELALLAGCGHTSAPVHRPPRVALLSTGDELVPVGHWPGRGQIVDSNGLMLACQLRQAGADVVDLGIVVDRPGELQAAIDRALAPTSSAPAADIIVTCGGISVGDHDLVLPTLVARGAELVFRRVRMRPGRPTTLAVLRDGERRVPVFALPGNPASAHVACELFVRLAVRRWLGHPDLTRTPRDCLLAAPVARDARRTHVVRVRVEGEHATPLPSQTSGALRSIAGHNALAFLSPGTGPALPGTTVPTLLLEDN